MNGIITAIILSSAGMAIIALIAYQLFKLIGTKTDAWLEQHKSLNDITEKVLIYANDWINSYIVENPDAKWADIIDNAVKGLMEGLNIKESTVKRVVNSIMHDKLTAYPSTTKFIQTAPKHLIELSKATDK